MVFQKQWRRLEGDEYSCWDIEHECKKEVQR